jgi:hypothetical protein
VKNVPKIVKNSKT